MEIQTFFLCKNITQLSAAGEYDAHLVGLHNFYSLDGKFPIEFDISFFMSIRRETRGPEQTISLRFNLINSDGFTIGEPRNIKVGSTFPAGFMFKNFHGTIHFSFPAPGDYRLDITADEEINPFTFQYNIEIPK
jgi:hypothetical protein